MLEAHAPHEPIHTWKGFFIHIATIAVGLLIAIGLEQTVEFFRHRDEVAMTREALHQERERDRANLALRAMEVRREHVSLDNNLLVLAYLKEHPGTSSAQLPGILTWHSKRPELTTAAWSTAQQTFVTGLMPAGEVRELAKFYSHIALVAESYWRTLNDARLYAFRDPDPSHLSASQVDQIIEATQRALRALFLQEVTLVNLNDEIITIRDVLRLALVMRSR